MKKIIKRIVIAVVAIALVAVLGLAGSLFSYYPHYAKSKTQVEFKNNYDGKIAVMSCNVRCINPLDFGHKNWFYRADLVVKGIENNMPSIIGFQEATKWQYNYLCSSLPGYDSIITYRDKKVNSEGCPIFYRSDLYELVEKDSFWLSETPDEMSKDWGAACYRICSYAILKDKESGKQFVVFNTHLDHVSDEARINGIGVVLEKIEKFGSLPSIIMGDFNADESSETYKSVTGNFLDAKYQTENTMIGCTYQCWGTALDRENIDYFMISKTGFTIDEYKVITDTYDGDYSSDHFPIFTVLELA